MFVFEGSPPGDFQAVPILVAVISVALLTPATVFVIIITLFYTRRTQPCQHMPAAEVFQLDKNIAYSPMSLAEEGNTVSTDYELVI